MGKPEGAVEAHLKQIVEAAGGLCLKFTSGIAGVPDRIVVLAGRTVFVELKAPGEKPRPLQEERFAQMRAAGATVLVADTVERCDAVLTALRSAEPIPEELWGVPRSRKAPVLVLGAGRNQPGKGQREERSR